MDPGDDVEEVEPTPEQAEYEAAFKAMMERAIEEIEEIRLMGATGVEIGFTNDEAQSISEMDWYAKANFGGQSYFVEHHLHPLAALQDLVRQLGVERPKRSKKVQFSSDDRQGQLEPKVPGQHRYIATAMFALKPGQVRQVHMGNRVNLDQTTLMDIMVGCIDCEERYTEDMRKEPCAGEEFSWQT